MTRTIIKKFDYGFEVQPVPCIGSPYVGRGKTMMEALGQYLHLMQTEWDIFIDVDESAWPDELKRRKEELAKR